MSLNAGGKARTVRNKHYRPVDTRTLGKSEEDRFFCIIRAYAAKLPRVVERIERSDRQLDMRGADGKVIFLDGTRCYFDIKSTVGAIEAHGRLGSLVPAFLVLSGERDRTVAENFAAFISGQHALITARTQGASMVTLERRMAAAPA